MEKIKRILRFPLIVLIRFYRLLISPFLGNRCRFYPSCSHYAEEAIKERGLLIGGCLAIWRLLRCHPLSKGGIDLVPKKGKRVEK